MRYYFNIYSPDGIDADESGQEFSSMEAASKHVCEMLRELTAREEGRPNWQAIRQSVIEISNDDGDSKVMLLADVLGETPRGKVLSLVDD
jgi:dihydroxyacetone kinase